MVTMFRGDLKPDLRIALTDGGTAVDLTTATAVKVIGQLDGSPLFSRAADSATADGVVTMSWQSADTATTGQIAVEVEVTWPGSKPQTFRPPEVIHVLADFG